MRVLSLCVGVLLVSMANAQQFYIEAGGAASTRFNTSSIRENYNINGGGFYFEMGGERSIFTRSVFLTALRYVHEKGSGEFLSNDGQGGSAVITDRWRFNSLEASAILESDLDRRLGYFVSGNLGIGWSISEYSTQPGESDVYFVIPNAYLQLGTFYTLIEELELCLSIRAGGSYNISLMSSDFQPYLGLALGLRYTIIE